MDTKENHMNIKDFEILEKLANLLRNGAFSFDEISCCDDYDDELRIGIIIKYKEVKENGNEG